MLNFSACTFLLLVRKDPDANSDSMKNIEINLCRFGPLLWSLRE